MPRAVPVPTGTTSVQAVSGAVTLLGFSVRDSGATPADAAVVLRSGTADTDPAVVFAAVSGGASETTRIPAVDCPEGVFVERVTGETELVLFVG